ncbi:MAG: hypothetical protein CMH49_10410 [Myxococcales bacterium]|nr:hypothetical protein [Myxococcales bacterium]
MSKIKDDPLGDGAESSALNSLSALREDIDEIDRSLIALLESRLEICRTIAEVKDRAGFELRQKEREEMVVAQLQAQSQDELLQQKIVSIYKIISQLCLETQFAHLGHESTQELKRQELDQSDLGSSLSTEDGSDSLIAELESEIESVSNIALSTDSDEHEVLPLDTELKRSGSRLKTLGGVFIKAKLGRLRWRKDELANTLRSAPLSEEQRKWLTQKGFAHRGLHDALSNVAENSLPSFEAAIRHGFGIELDVHLSSDGIPMVFHDEELGRMTGVEGEICEYSYEELKSLKLIPGHAKIPSLEESLKLINGQVPILVEVKNYGKLIGPLEKAIAEVIKDYQGPLTVQSFNPMSLKWFYKHMPHIPRGLIAYSFPVEEVPMKASTRFLLKNLLFAPICKPHYVAYEHQDLARHRLRRLHRMRLRGTPLLVWTVRTQEHANLALKRADNIIFESFLPSND